VNATGKKILIADDSASMRQLMSFALTSAGYSVITAHNGREALALAESVKFDMVLTDLNMPELDGIGLIKGIRQIPRLEATPVVMLSTEGKEDKKKQGIEAGASQWLTKPFTPDTLLSAVRKHLR